MPSICNPTNHPAGQFNTIITPALCSVKGKARFGILKYRTITNGQTHVVVILFSSASKLYNHTTVQSKQGKDKPWHKSSFLKRVYLRKRSLPR